MLKFLSDVENRHFFRLWLAQLISQCGDRIHQMALVGLISERMPGSVLGLAKIISFTIIPVFLIGPLAGVYVDRWDRRATMFWSDFLRGGLVLTIPLIWIFKESLVPIYIVVFLSFALSRFHVPAKMSMIPLLVADQDLTKANSWMTLNAMIAFILGVSLGGYVVEIYGARSGFIWDAVTFFLSGALVFSISIPKPVHFVEIHLIQRSEEFIGRIRKSILTEMREGLNYVLRKQQLRTVIQMFFVLLAASGSVYVVIIVFIQETFQSTTKDLTVLALALGGGLLTGAFFYGKWGQWQNWLKTIFRCLFAGGIMLALFAFLVHRFSNILMAMGLAFIFGMVIGPIFIATNTAAHLFSDSQMRGKVFTTLEMVIHFAFLTAMLVSSFLAGFVSYVWILVGVGGILVLFGLWGCVCQKSGPVDELTS